MVSSSEVSADVYATEELSAAELLSFAEESLESPEQPDSMPATSARESIKIAVFFMISSPCILDRAIPHKDCATDASSNFSSDETKSGVNT